ncbi:MAG TPA: T9SS type A sorting domain-containing protein [Panacibacter sp.]|nr:T9SS type A sorting domain-containing protein [Panacibacter sp.]HNP45327.1 T9SS type A sorting domain-containing protein [Panacibacter sp.]
MNTLLQHAVAGRKACRLKKIKRLTLIFILLLFSAVSVWASHFRYGNVQWQNTDGNTVVFKIQQAWRWSYFGNPGIGTVVDIVAGDGDVPFDFGDGELQNIQITVTSINAAEDWFFGEITMTHTYAAPGNYTASFIGCCRISTLQNNADEYFHVQTLVSVGKGQKSTVSTVSPIIDLQVEKPTASFTIPAIDPDGGTLIFRFANADEAAGADNSYVLPDGLSINSTTGLVTFSTMGKTVGDLYTAQVMINNGKTEIGVDFLIRIVEAQTGTPPYFVYPPTPANNETFTISVGDHLTFDVKAQDDDNGSTVTLTGVGLPPGSTTNPELPATGQPINSTFDWTPGFADAGTYILTFKATDNDGSSALTSVNIVVNAVCDPKFSSTITVNPSPTVPNQAANTIFLGYGPQSVTLTASATGGNGSNTYDWGSAGSGASIVVSPTTTTTYIVTVTDAFKCTTTNSVTIYVEDVRCGKYGNKILVCYNGCQLCKPVDKVANLLKHRKARLGTCSGSIPVAAFADNAEAGITKQITVKQIKIYPNPAQSYVVLDMQQDSRDASADIRILDITGRTMMNMKSNQPQQTINVGSLGSGVYLLQVIDASGKITGSQRFIITK